MQFNTYTSAGAHIAAALVNDPMTDRAAVGALLAGFDVEEPVPGEAELADLRDWTARLGRILPGRYWGTCSIGKGGLPGRWVA